MDRAGAEEADHPAHPVRVLILEDDPWMRSLLASTLAEDEYEVAEAADATALLAALRSSLGPVRRNRLPDVIVSDLRMPGVDGLEVLRALRAAGDYRPFILMTAFGDPATHEVAREMGAAVAKRRRGSLDGQRASRTPRPRRRLW